MSDLAAAGVASIETLAFPLKPAAAASDDPWPAAAGAKDLAALQARLLRGRVTLVPLMAAAAARAFPEEALNDPSIALLPAARRAALEASLTKAAAGAAKARRAWTSQAAFLVRFVRAGGRVAAGTGFEFDGYPVPGAGLHRELAALVRAGLTPAEALRAATTAGAELVGAPKTDAGLTPGARADFIVVQGDPLTRIGDLDHVTHVVRAGELLDPSELIALARSSASPRAK